MSPRITLHLVEAGAERTLTRCVGWLAGRRLPRLAGNLTTSSSLDRGERTSGGIPGNYMHHIHIM